MKRKPGYANIEQHPNGSGLYRVRARIDGKLVTVASKLDESMALATAQTYAEIRSARSLQHGITVAQFGGGFLDRRELRGIRSMQQDRGRWRSAIEADPIGGYPLATLKRRDLVEWRDRMIARKLARQTIKNAINLLRVALAEALDRDLVESNVAHDLGVPRSVSGGRSREDLTGVLSPEEQVAVLEATPEAERHTVLFALHTGLRWSEQSWLRWSDIDGETATIRLSVNGLATKTGSARSIPLFGPAKEALAVASALRKPGSKWVFPGAGGTPRKQRPKGWLSWVKAAKVGRRVRWHDLRHTCATALLAGWWSERRWTLPEIAQMLGHEEVSTTEIYARKLDETLFAAARRMTFPGGNRMGGNSAKLAAVHSFPKPQVVDSSSTGGTACFPLDSRAASLNAGTFGELPRSLQRAIKRTVARSPEGALYRRLAKAWPAIAAGNEAAATPELRRAVATMGLVMGSAR